MQLQFPDLPTDTAVATVLYDATRVGPQAQEEMEARWRTLSSQLAEQGAGTELLEVLSQRVLENTGAPGRHGRLLVATPNNIAVDRLLTEPPALHSTVLGRRADVLALAWQADAQVQALLVEANRSAADLTIVDSTIAPERSAEDSVTANQDGLTKCRESGLSHRRIHARAEASWERNGTQIAEEIDNRVREQR